VSDLTGNPIQRTDLSAGEGTRPFKIVTLLVAVMISAVYLRSALTVLSGFIIEEFGISRAQFGWIFAVFAISGAIMSPLMGSVVDGSARRGLLAVFAFATAGALLAGLASGFVALIVAAAVAGGALATGNPSTNRVVAERIPISIRGLATGVKQSGPPLTLLVVGIALPAIALAVNWRLALVSGIVVPVVGSVFVLRLIERDHVIIPRAARRSLTQGERRTVTWLAATSFFMATALGSVQAFLPLYALEDVSMSASAAGFMAALVGLGGLVGRITWTTIEHRFKSRVTLLVWIPIGAAVPTGLIAFATPQTPWLLAVGAFGAGLLMLAWHAVAWLFVINTSHHKSIGRSSSVMQIGSFMGFGLGPVLTGYLVDATGSYLLNWAVVILLFLLVSVMAIRLRHYLTLQLAEEHGSVG
jgi:predicted MFS family arabinose efflux permease